VNSKHLLWLGLVVLAIVAYALWWNSPARELRRTHDALLLQKTWHLHAVRNYQGIPPQTDDIDFLCPGFEHQVNQYTDWSGAPAVRETIRYNGAFNNRINGRWTKTNDKTEIFECRHEPLMEGDGISLPFELVLLRSTKIRRGAVRTVGSDSCRDYQITVLTPYDLLHHDYQFTMCINELDHLPRETRRDARISGHEDAVEYSKWGDLSEPPLPYGIP
jgi:hypothetical protein